MEFHFGGHSWHNEGFGARQPNIEGPRGEIAFADPVFAEIPGWKSVNLLTFERELRRKAVDSTFARGIFQIYIIEFEIDHRISYTLDFMPAYRPCPPAARRTDS
jgi:hypothetical protein